VVWGVLLVGVAHGCRALVLESGRTPTVLPCTQDALFIGKRTKEKNLSVAAHKSEMLLHRELNCHRLPHSISERLNSKPDIHDVICFAFFRSLRFKTFKAIRYLAASKHE